MAYSVAKKIFILILCVPIRFVKFSAGFPIFYPRIELRIHVQISEVDATNGMRNHIGLNVKLMMVEGTHTFQSATISS